MKPPPGSGTAAPDAAERAPQAGPAPQPGPAPKLSPAPKPAPAPTGKPDAERAEAKPGEPAPAPRPAAPSAPSDADRPSLELVIERWPQIVDLLSRNPAVKPLIVACRPIALEASTLTLGFPESQSFYKDVAERRRAALEEGVSRVLGVPLRVSCVAANVEGSPLGSDPEGARLLAEFKRIYGDEVVDVREVD